MKEVGAWLNHRTVGCVFPLIHLVGLVIEGLKDFF